MQKITETQLIHSTTRTHSDHPMCNAQKSDALAEYAHLFAVGQAKHILQGSKWAFTCHKRGRERRNGYYFSQLYPGLPIGDFGIHTYREKMPNA
ncbi:hypothetical protein JTE90_012334 [Oedothorax gibbosus]|uniref:Uncharacterized protein n=1 Tax=Oedothorax gibbosus TaxID=931172 RepID=A0AAV6VKE8_9ARAC|nr:hypothetical protein JTE90_012334 [Oedothorax gibbosus]